MHVRPSPAHDIPEFLCIFVAAACVEPHQAGPAPASPPDLDEEEASQLACTPDLVVVPGDDGIGVVGQAVDLELPRSAPGHSALQCQHVGANDAAAGPHLLWEDIDWPDRV